MSQEVLNSRNNKTKIQKFWDFVFTWVLIAILVSLNIQWLTDVFQSESNNPTNPLEWKDFGLVGEGNTSSFRVYEVTLQGVKYFVFAGADKIAVQPR